MRYDDDDKNKCISGVWWMIFKCKVCESKFLLIFRVSCMNHALAVMNDHKERFLAASNMSRVEKGGVFSANLIVSLTLSMYIILFLPLLRFPGKRPCSMRLSSSFFYIYIPSKNLQYILPNITTYKILYLLQKQYHLERKQRLPDGNRKLKART